MDPLTCRRCRGFMHPVDLLDPLDVIQGGKPNDVRAWRCLTCGDLIDQVIMQNRLRVRDQRRVRRQPPLANRSSRLRTYNNRQRRGAARTNGSVGPTIEARKESRRHAGL
jgi:hypothetical protein